MTSDEHVTSENGEMDEKNGETAPETEAETGAGEPDKDQIIAGLQLELAEMKDRVLRAAAEMENLRKRTQREVADTRAYAIADFARDMLTATDNLERALMAMPKQARETADASTKSLIEGIEMTEREMQRLMQKNGVKPILAEGEKFNPHKHQAMFEVPDDSVPEGIVVQVVQAGFEIGDRVLRPAMVGVSKGGPKAQPTPDTAQPTPDNAQPAPDADDGQPDEADPKTDTHIDKEA